MSEPSSQPEETSEDRRHSEAEPGRPTPRIYIASLADYVDGRLHGVWVDADQPADALYGAAASMLAKSPLPGAEEIAIHDFEGFGPMRLSEYLPLEAVSALARGIVEHGEAFAHWAHDTWNGWDTNDLNGFEDAYIGTWPSVRDYAEHLADEFGVDEAIEAADLPLGNYVRLDIDLLARDLEIELATSEGPEGVHIFSC